MKELSAVVADKMFLWDAAHVSLINSLPLQADGTVPRANLTKMADENLIHSNDMTCEFFPLYDEDSWSLFVLTNSHSLMSPIREAE